MDASGSRIVATKSHRSPRLHRNLISCAILLFAIALLFFAARAAYPASPRLPAELDWTMAPVDQRIPIARAAFDKGGYILRTPAGSKVVVPFTGNLFVMKFGVSTNGSMAFENQGDAPALYLPKDGYVDNAVVPNAHWQPFSPEFQPEIPVFVGMAPSWSAFLNMSWRPDMSCLGGFWTATAYRPGSPVIQTVDLIYVVDGRAIDGWDAYRRWSTAHPSAMRIAVADPGLYRRVAEARRLYAHRRGR